VIDIVDSIMIVVVIDAVMFLIVFPILRNSEIVVNRRTEASKIGKPTAKTPRKTTHTRRVN
jgi:hypothetical protein